MQKRMGAGFPAVLMLAAALTTASMAASPGQTPAPAPARQASSAEPPGYVIGAGDVLSVGLWQEPSTAAEVVVRPDGKVSLPLVNEIDAAGLTTVEFRSRLEEAYKAFYETPSVMLAVKAINSRNVFVQGEVAKPGAYPLLQELTISQMLAVAGGLTQYADKKHISIIRHSELRPDGQPVSYSFNYDDFVKRKNLKQDILLKPRDVIVVPE